MIRILTFSQFSAIIYVYSVKEYIGQTAESQDIRVVK